MAHVPDELRVDRYGVPDPASPVPVAALAWRTTGYALVIQVGLGVVVALLAAFVDGALTADEPDGRPTFAGFGLVLCLVGGLAAVAVTALAGFSTAWLLESAVRRFAPPARREAVALAVFALVGGVVGGALVALALRDHLGRPGGVDPFTAGALVWGVVAGALPAGAGRWLAPRRRSRAPASSRSS
jgi:hypothetical protein